MIIKHLPFVAILVIYFGVCNLFGQEKRLPLNLKIDVSSPTGEIDLSCYSLGQGGLSSQPMIDSHHATGYISYILRPYDFSFRNILIFILKKGNITGKSWIRHWMRLLQPVPGQFQIYVLNRLSSFLSRTENCASVEL